MSSFTGAQASFTVESLSVAEAESLLGNSAADKGAWHAGVQQSIRA